MRATLLAAIGAISFLATDTRGQMPGRFIDREAEKKLQVAFGRDDKEVQAAKYKVMLKKSFAGWVFACNTFEVQDGGRVVKLAPLLAAYFYPPNERRRAKALGQRLRGHSGAYILITTAKPVKSPAEFQQAEIRRLQMFVGQRGEPFGKP